MREQAEPLEADLARYYHVDLADHWRHDGNGRRLLTLRRIGVLVAHFPDDSALALEADPHPVWRLTDILLAHVWQAAANSKQQHPMLTAEYRRVKSTTPRLADQTRVAAARRRAAQRAQAIADGVIT